MAESHEITQLLALAEDGDTEAFDRVQEQVDALGEEIAAPAPNGQQTDQQKADSDPAFIAWRAQNAWYGDDIELTAYAEQIAPVIGRKHQGAAFYDAIGTEIRRKFPDKFTNTRRQRARSVEPAGGGGGGRRGNGHTYADLPADAKAACDRFIKQGMFTAPDGSILPVDKAREKYVSNYDWSE